MDRVRRILMFRGYAIPEEDRRDLEQVVMAQVWEVSSRPDFDPTAGFWGFVELVVARRCIDWLRTRREEISLDARDLEIAEGLADPLEDVLTRERDERVRSAVARLPTECQDLIRLRLGDDLSYAAAAELLGSTEGALRARMFRCVRRVRRLLRDLEFQDETRSRA